MRQMPPPELWNADRQEHLRRPRTFPLRGDASSGLTALSDAAEQHYQSLQAEHDIQYQSPRRGHPPLSDDITSELVFESYTESPWKAHALEHNLPRHLLSWDHAPSHPLRYRHPASDYRVNEDAERSQKRYRSDDDALHSSMETHNELYPRPEHLHFRHPPTNTSPLAEFSSSAPRQESAFTRVSPRQEQLTRYPTSPYPPSYYNNSWSPQQPHYEEPDYYRQQQLHAPNDHYADGVGWAPDDVKKKKRTRDHREQREPSSYSREMVLGTS